MEIIRLATMLMLCMSAVETFAAEICTDATKAENLRDASALLSGPVDKARPVVAVANLKEMQRVSSSPFVVQGTAKDNDQVKSVLVRLNGGSWTSVDEFQPSSANTWTTTVALTTRTNLLEICAEDNAGNRSATNKIKFLYIETAVLELQTNGVGAVKSNFKGEALELGRSYTVSAVPASGQLFSNWSGTVTSTNRTLTFAMEPNMVLTANFVSNRFVGAKGNYSGLFFPSKGLSISNSGSIALTLKESGTFSAKITAAGAVTTVSGSFDVAGRCCFSRSNSVLGNFGVELEVDFSRSALVGWVTNATSKAELFGVLAAPSSGWKGRYTMVALGSTNAVAPAGSGAGSVVVGAQGNATIQATLADGTAISCSTAVGPGGEWPLYVSLYHNRGILIGWMKCDSNMPCAWIKLAAPGERYYSNGFAFTQPVFVLRYTAPAKGQSVLEWANGIVSLDGGNLAGAIRTGVSLNKNRFTLTGGTLTNWNLVADAATGLFSGSFVDPASGRICRIKGALLQHTGGDQGFGGGGWFMGATRSGNIRLNRYIPPPTILGASQTRTTGFTLSWGAVDGATGYQLEISTNANFDGSVIRTISNGSLTYDVTGAIPGVTYFYRMGACIAEQLSEWSDGASATTTSVSVVPDIVWIPEGVFTMGSPATEAQRGSDEQQMSVEIQRGFFMSRNLVTQAEFLSVMGRNPSFFSGDGRLPVEQVNWYDAVNYCATLTQQERLVGRLPEGWSCRLPTEAQWEYACRAGTTSAFYFGNGLHSGMANFYAHYEYDASVGDIYIDVPDHISDSTTVVGAFGMNPKGLNDMCGNVWQWCQDWYGAYPTDHTIDPVGPITGSMRVVRGGSWGSIGRNCRSAARGYIDPGLANCFIGFRIVVVQDNP